MPPRFGLSPIGDFCARSLNLFLRLVLFLALNSFLLRDFDDIDSESDEPRVLLRDRVFFRFDEVNDEGEDSLRLYLRLF